MVKKTEEEGETQAVFEDFKSKSEAIHFKLKNVTLRTPENQESVFKFSCLIWLRWDVEFCWKCICLKLEILEVSFNGKS